MRPVADQARALVISLRALAQLPGQGLAWQVSQDLEAFAQDLDKRLEADRQRQHNLAHNLAARLDNLAGALADLQADLVAGHKHRPRLAELAGYWAKIAAECSANAQELKEAGR